MENCLNAEATQTGMSMNNLDLFSNDNVSKDREEREDGWKGSFAIDNEKWHVVDFETIREVMNTCSTIIGMRDNDNLVSSINELLRIISTASQGRRV